MTAQSTQLPCPVLGWYLPAGHAAHEAALVEALNVPAPHALHVPAPVAEYLPAAQSSQAVPPGAVLKVPAAHAVHADAADAAE